MAYFLVPDAILFDFVHFSEIQLVCDRRTDGRMDGRTNGRRDRRTDTQSYREARTHLKCQLLTNVKTLRVHPPSPWWPSPKSDEVIFESAALKSNCPWKTGSRQQNSSFTLSPPFFSRCVLIYLPQEGVSVLPSIR